jgi:hypothetical protein
MNDKLYTINTRTNILKGNSEIGSNKQKEKSTYTKNNKKSTYTKNSGAGITQSV